MRARIAIKKPYLTVRNQLARKVWANEHALLLKIFVRNNSGTAPQQSNISPSFTQYGNGKQELLGNPKIWREKVDASGFYCPRWSEMSPKSLWNDKFDQIFADSARKSIAGNVFGRKIAAR